MGQGAKDVVLEGVTKRFGTLTAVHPLTLTVPKGEFLTLLGPSGCGKTTLLRMIAGLEGVSGGCILVGGADVTDLPPNRRDTSIMFQDYALFPHKTLIDNIGYGLKMRGLAKVERDARAREWLARIELPGHALRYPHELSGGQRQRVALARSLIISPGVLLLDEPLGALDANLRRQLQGELKRIHREVGLTFIYVTHDQEEALTMSDRIAVMREGRVEQLGSPAALYDRPETEFVARFLGVPNIFTARVIKAKGGMVEAESTGLGKLRFRAGGIGVGEQVALALRPSNIELRRAGRGPNGIKVAITDVAFAGNTLRILANTSGGETLTIEHERRHDSADPPREGEKCRAQWTEASLIPLKGRSP